MIPDIRYYARLSLSKDTQTPKYVITHEAGFYEPMRQLSGKDGKVSFFLMQKRESQPTNTPPMYLQAKNSYNFTGLKDYYIDGKISGFAYGYPLKGKTYKYRGKEAPNPFLEYRNDGYLFLIDSTSTPKPNYIELIVLEDAKDLIASYCKMLIMGGFDEALDRLRNQCKPCF